MCVVDLLSFINILMMYQVLLVGVLLVLTSPSCEPYGLRIHYGDVLTDPSSSHKALLYFNTPLYCNSSYMTLKVGSSLKKI